MERNDVVYSRSSFLREMRQQMISGKNIVYWNETQINKNHTMSKCWIDKSSAKKATGVKVSTVKWPLDNTPCWGEGTISSQCNSHIQVQKWRWLSQPNEFWYIFPNILPFSTIMMDNAFYHFRKIHKISTSNNKGTVMKKKKLKIKNESLKQKAKSV